MKELEEKERKDASERELYMSKKEAEAAAVKEVCCALKPPIKCIRAVDVTMYVRWACCYNDDKHWYWLLIT
jgi:hypothetical protein